MTNNNRRWTPAEEEVVMRYAKAYQQNLSKCFMVVSEHLSDLGNPRTPQAVKSHWYGHLSKKSSLCLFSVPAQQDKADKGNIIQRLWSGLCNIINKVHLW